MGTVALPSWGGCLGVLSVMLLMPPGQWSAAKQPLNSPLLCLLVTHPSKRPTLQVMSMIPGFNANFMGAGGDKQSAMMVKRYITIIESMTDKELDSTNIKIFSEHSRIMRLARGSGAPAHMHGNQGPGFVLKQEQWDSPLPCASRGQSGRAHSTPQTRRARVLTVGPWTSAACRSAGR